MATKDDIGQIKKSLQELRKGQLEILLKLENLDERISNLESGDGGEAKKPAEPEPILTCVQCSLEYLESENAEGSCHYHNGVLRGMGWDYKYTCCDKKSRNYDAAKTIPGCVKGKHRSQHHTDYGYSAYIFYMQNQSNKAKEIWMEMDVEDLVTERCEWSEVGKTEDDNIFILVGTSRVEYTVISVYTPDQLKALNEDTVALEKENEIGWKMRAEVLVKEQVIRVSLKAASNESPLVKQVGYQFDKNGQLCAGVVKVLNDPTTKTSGSYTVPEDTHEGPELQIGEDYSQNRKNDYEFEITGSCPLKLQQVSNTEVSSTIQSFEGKWNNMFSCKTKVTNTGQENISVTDVSGYYKNKEGEWIKVDEVAVGKEFFRGNYEWFDTSNFWLNGGTTGSLLVRLIIKIEGTPPSSQYEGRWAHSSLPQPLHLKFTFTDQNNDTVSLQFEQGNKPLDIATREKRIKNWAKDEADLLFWTCADDIDSNKRSDVAIYKDENGILCYRPAVLDNGGQTYYLASIINKLGYKAKKAGQKEYEISDWKKESKGSSIIPYALVDVETATMFGVKVVIATPTSTTTGHCLLPLPSTDSMLTIKEDKVPVKGDVLVSWKVYKASKCDRLVMYPVNGKKSLSGTVNNKQKATEGEAKLKAPDKPGEYEVRYYAAWLQGQYTGYRHDGYIAAARFSVTV